MKVFIVIDDDHVEGVYTTRANAELAQKLFVSDHIMECDVDDFAGAPVGKFWYVVTMDKEGAVHSVKIENAKYANAYKWEPYGDDKLLAFTIWAKDEIQAVEFANECRNYLIMNKLWDYAACYRDRTDMLNIKEK